MPDVRTRKQMIEDLNIWWTKNVLECIDTGDYDDVMEYDGECPTPADIYRCLLQYYIGWAKVSDSDLLENWIVIQPTKNA